ncbi:MAG: SIS domain-containing protein [Actinobacteria bacterium]|nr:SIS domain-containing protein [Actinomycetota bacterium]
MKRFDVYKEIHDQPLTWELIIEEFEKNKGKIREFLSESDSFIFTGCGSGYNASVYSKNLSEYFLEKYCFDYQASEIKFFSENIYKKGALKKPVTFLFSRSGDTTETVDALKKISSSGLSKSFGITCNEDSYLYKNSDFSFSLSKASEKAVVTTKSFTSMAILPLLIFSSLSEDNGCYNELKKLPDFGRKIINKYENMGKVLGQNEDIKKFFILSNIPNFGLAREVKLKILEMTLSWADCFNTLDFRHGPRAVVDRNSLIIIFLSDKAVSYELNLARELKEMGAKLLVFGDIVPKEFYNLTDDIIEIGEKISEWLRGVLFLPVIHFLAYYKAVKKRLNPDKPKNLTYFVEIK